MEACVARYGDLVDKYLASGSEHLYRALRREQERYLQYKADLQDPSSNENVKKFKQHKAKLTQSNDALLRQTQQIHTNTTEQLRHGLQAVETAKQQGTATLQVLEKDRDTIVAISKSHDDTQAELHRSQSLLTRIMKVISTNKIISILSLFAIALAIGIVVYKTR